MFIELQVQYMKMAGSEHAQNIVYINCYECQNKNNLVHTTCSELAIFMYWISSLINNQSSYCGLVDVRISAFDKDLPVQM